MPEGPSRWTAICLQGLFLVSPAYRMDFGYIEQVWFQIATRSYRIQALPGGTEKLRAGGRLMHPASRNGDPMPVDARSFDEFYEVRGADFLYSRTFC